MKGLLPAVVLGGLVARALVLFQGPRLALQAEEAHRILLRTPYSAAHQSRLVEPALVLLATTLTRLDWIGAYASALAALSVASIVLTVFVFRLWLGSWSDGLRYGVLSGALLLLLQDRQWLHLSDLVDVLMATAFAYGVFTEAGLAWFTGLFVVSILNRESALFIPLWLVLSAMPVASDGDKDPIPKRRLVVGVTGVVIGLVGVGALRAALYAGAPAPHRLVTPWGSHVTLKHNLYDTWRALSGLDAEALSVYAAVVTAGTLVWLSRRRLPKRVRRVPLLLLAMAGSISVFGLILETRSWLMTTPFLLFLHAATSERPAATGSPSMETPGASS